MFNRLRPVLCLVTTGLAMGWLLTAKADGPEKLREQFTASQKQFAAKMLDAVKDYEQIGRVDDEARWAPFLCREPLPGRAQFSKSGDADTHGQKLYSLFAKNRDGYVARPAKPAPIGQIIIKESWIPEEVTSKEEKEAIAKNPLRTTASSARSWARLFDHFSPYASKDGKTFKASKKAGLFVMMKLDPKTPETDAGWIYGTVSADAKTLTAVGKITACMECHVKAKNDRLFGLSAK